VNCEEIIATVNELRRFSDFDLKRPSPRGAYVRSTIIPRCTPAEAARAEYIGDAPTSVKVQWVPVRFLVTYQPRLTIKSLRYAARTYVHHQRKGDHIPTLVHLGRGRYYVRDGNHRSTIAALIGGDLRIKALVVRKPNRKRRLTRKRKHG